MSYLALKAFHVAAVLTWVAGLTATAVVSATLTPPLVPAELRIVSALRRWNQRVTTPSMIVLLGVGVTLAIEGNWLRDRWLHAKLLLVFALFALHGVQSGTLRRLSRRDLPARSPLRWAPGAILSAAAAIVALVVTKAL